jgi:hypothetical protein
VKLALVFALVRSSSPSAMPCVHSAAYNHCSALPFVTLTFRKMGWRGCKDAAWAVTRVHAGKLLIYMLHATKANRYRAWVLLRGGTAREGREERAKRRSRRTRTEFLFRLLPATLTVTFVWQLNDAGRPCVWLNLGARSRKSRHLFVSSQFLSINICKYL